MTSGLKIRAETSTTGGARFIKSNLKSLTVQLKTLKSPLANPFSMPLGAVCLSPLRPEPIFCMCNERKVSNLNFSIDRFHIVNHQMKTLKTIPTELLLPFIALDVRCIWSRGGVGRSKKDNKFWMRTSGYHRMSRNLKLNRNPHARIDRVKGDNLVLSFSAITPFHNNHLWIN